MDNIGVNRGVDDIILDEKQATLFETKHLSVIFIVCGRCDSKHK